MTNRLKQTQSTSSPSYPRLEEVEIAKIKPANWNPRKCGRKGLGLLEKSYEEFGNLQPIVINKRTNTLLAGHQRLKILIRRNEKTTRAWVIDKSPEEEKIINLALNNHAGKFDMKGLGSMLAEIKNMTDDLDCTLFEEDEIDRIISQTLPELVDIESIDKDINNMTTGHENHTDHTNNSVSQSFKYDLYFENATDKLKFASYMKNIANNCIDANLNGDALLIAFKVP